MSDARQKLQRMFDVATRHPNFGDCIVSMHVRGIRCHTNTIIDIQSPITAFCGLNGTGKSTLLQLAAVAYRGRVGDPAGRYYVASFILSGTLDPEPYSATASVEYGYWQQDRTVRRLTISRGAGPQRWFGYRRQPARLVYFAGMGLYLPRIETRDFVVRNATRLQVLGTAALAPEARQWVEQILTSHYDAMDRNTIKHPKENRFVVTAARGAHRYSEANMGCGEGRIQHFVQQIESLPERSLILLEEPETSLHQSAQFELGKYLIDACIRRKHQIFLTTHSENLLAALPAASRIYLDRSAGAIRLIYGLSSTQAASLMANAGTKALYILVEDDVARAVLREIVRTVDAQFLRTVHIAIAGDKDAIQRTMQALRDANLPIAAVRDGDTGGNPQQNLFSLPGTRPPEREICGCPAVATFLQERYGVMMTDFLTTVDANNHHTWFDKLAAATSNDESAIVAECARIYVTTLTENERDALVEQLKAAIA